MEKIQDINSQRIAWCCTDYGITTGMLAQELGIAVSSMQQLMAGKTGLSFIQLRKIADYFGRGVLFFLEPEPVADNQVHTAQFRTLANQKPELSANLKGFIERVEKQRDVYLSLLTELNETERSHFKPPEIPTNNPSLAAGIVRQWLALKETNDFDSYRSGLEAKSILVFRSNGYNGKWQIAKENPILGFSLYREICPVIVVKKRQWNTQQSFTLMHELGHLLLHKISAIDDEQDMQSRQGMEQEANAFAGHLLVPDSFLSSICDADRPDVVSGYDAWLERYRKNWGVSSEVILRRLRDSNRLSQQQYTAYREWANQVVKSVVIESAPRVYRYREPKNVFGETYVKTVLDALNARHITLAKASSYLDNLKITQLHQLDRYVAGI